MKRQEEKDCRYSSLPTWRKYTAINTAKLASEKSIRMPYVTRHQGEANLHMVLHEAIAEVSLRLKAIVPEFAASILVPLKVKGSRFYSKKIWNDDRLYFKRRLEEPSLAQHAHRHRGFARAIDGDIDDHDEVAKRGLAYCFDRSATRGDQRAKEIMRNYCMDLRAGKRNIHGHRSWIDVTSVHEHHATTGRIAALKNRQIERSLQIQGAWSKAQKVSMENRRETCAHVLSVITRELHAEAERDFLCLNEHFGNSKQKRLQLARHEKARCEAADRIMRVIAEYGVARPAREADYLRYTVETMSRNDPAYAVKNSHMNLGVNSQLRFSTAATMLGGVEESQTCSIQLKMPEFVCEPVAEQVGVSKRDGKVVV